MISVGTRPRSIGMPPPSRGLMYQCVGLWKASTYSGSGDLLDQSGNGHDMAITGAAFDTDHFTFVAAESDYMETADHADFDLAPGDSCTVAIAMAAAAVGVTTVWMSKRAAGSTTASAAIGWMLQSASNATVTFRCSDGTIMPAGSFTDILDGSAKLVTGIRNVSTDKLTVFSGATVGTIVADTTTGTMENSDVVRIGRSSGAGLAYGDMTFYGAAFFRRVLSTGDLVRLAGVLGVPAS